MIMSKHKKRSKGRDSQGLSTDSLLISMVMDTVVLQFIIHYNKKRLASLIALR